jgi:spermidine/putrescine-binding protein
MEDERFVRVPPLTRRALLSGALGIAGAGLLAAAGPLSPAFADSMPTSRISKLTGSEWGGVWDTALTALAADFKKKTGYTMVNSIDDNNGLVKIQQSPHLYDVAWLTADKSTAGLVAGSLKPIDTSKITAYKNIPASLVNALRENGKLSGIPVSWGAIGILYRSDLVPFKITKWKDLWRPELANSVAIQAMPALGAATTVRMAARTWGSGPNDLTAAWKALAKLKPNVAYQYSVSSDALNKLADGSLKVAINFADMGLPLADKRVKVALPTAGYPWSPQVVCIPKDSQNVAGAYALMNYILDPEVQGKCVQLTSVGPANSKAVLPKSLTVKPLETQKVADRVWNDNFLSMGRDLQAWTLKWQQALS